MVVEVAWSPEALEDVEWIARYIQRDSAHFARAVVRRLVDTAEELGRFPELGRVVPEFDDQTIRQRVVYSYRLIYRVEPRRVLVLAVVHGSRLLTSLHDRF